MVQKKTPEERIEKIIQAYKEFSQKEISSREAERKIKNVQSALDPTTIDNNSFGNVWAVGSGKGGTGKTTISSILGLNLHYLGYNVRLIESDYKGANLFSRNQNLVSVSQKQLNELYKTGKEDEAMNLLGTVVNKNAKEFIKKNLDNGNLLEVMFPSLVMLKNPEVMGLEGKLSPNDLPVKSKHNGYEFVFGFTTDGGSISLADYNDDSIRPIFNELSQSEYNHIHIFDLSPGIYDIPLEIFSNADKRVLITQYEKTASKESSYYLESTLVFKIRTAVHNMENILNERDEKRAYFDKERKKLEEELAQHNNWESNLKNLLQINIAFNKESFELFEIAEKYGKLLTENVRYEKKIKPLNGLKKSDPVISKVKKDVDRLFTPKGPKNNLSLKDFRAMYGKDVDIGKYIDNIYEDFGNETYAVINMTLPGKDSTAKALLFAMQQYCKRRLTTKIKIFDDIPFIYDDPKLFDKATFSENPINELTKDTMRFIEEAKKQGKKKSVFSSVKKILSSVKEDVYSQTAAFTLGVAGYLGGNDQNVK